MTRVLMVHNDYLLPGGETMTMHEQVAALRDQGSDVAVLEVDNSEWLHSSKVRAASELSYSSAAAAAVRKAITEHRPDVVHTHNLFPSLGNGAMRGIAAYGLPWVQHVQNYRYSCLSANHFREGTDCHRCTKSSTALPGILHGCYRESKALSFGVAVFDAGRRTMLAAQNKPTAYIAVSQRMKQVLRDLSPRLGEIEVVYNSFDAPASARALAASSSRDGVIFVGRLTVEKGCRLAMEALNHLPDVPVTFVGDGILREEITNWVTARKNARLVLQAKRDEVMSLMAAAKVALALPLWEEPFGRTAIEAISVGTTVVSTARGAAPELIDASVGHLLSADPSPLEVARATANLLAVSSGEIAARSGEMHRYATRRFSAAVVAEELVKVYDRAIARHHAMLT